MADEDSASLTSSDSITTAAKWLLGAAGGLAAVSAAGLQFTTLGEARNQTVAILAFVVLFAAVAAVLAFAARVLLPACDSLADLADRQQKLRIEAGDKPAKYWPVAEPSEMVQFAKLDGLFEHLFNVTDRSPDELLEDARKATATQAKTLQSRLKEVLGVVNAYEARRRFKHLLGALVVAGLAIVSCVPVFALAVAKEDDGDDSPKVEKAIAVIVHFGSVPTELRSDGCAITDNFAGLAVGGTYAKPLVRLVAQHDCKAATLELPADASYELEAE